MADTLEREEMSKMLNHLYAPQGAMKFDQDYQEDIVLRDGSRARLRAVRPTDKERLQHGLQKLSADALMARFFTVKRHFSRKELEYLTEFDGIDHYAIGAVLLNEDGSEGEGLGVGRFVRLPDDASCAEPAVVVLDEWQNQGLGRILFDRLVAAARERGIRHFHTEFLPGNEGIQRLLEGICPELVVWRRGEILVADVPLPDVDEPRAESSRSAFSALLRLAAGKLIHPRLRGVPDEDEPASDPQERGAEPAVSDAAST
jgi:GNAT superfamily N-acetyltransferase